MHPIRFLHAIGARRFPSAWVFACVSMIHGVASGSDALPVSRGGDGALHIDVDTTLTRARYDLTSFSITNGARLTFDPSDGTSVLLLATGAILLDGIIDATDHTVTIASPGVWEYGDVTFLGERIRLITGEERPVDGTGQIVIASTHFELAGYPGDSVGDDSESGGDASGVPEAGELSSTLTLCSSGCGNGLTLNQFPTLELTIEPGQIDLDSLVNNPHLLTDSPMKGTGQIVQIVWSDANFVQLAPLDLPEIEGTLPEDSHVPYSLPLRMLLLKLAMESE